jgi:hypothetical protein
VKLRAFILVFNGLVFATSHAIAQSPCRADTPDNVPFATGPVVYFLTTDHGMAAAQRSEMGLSKQASGTTADEFSDADPIEAAACDVVVQYADSVAAANDGAGSEYQTWGIAHATYGIGDYVVVLILPAMPLASYDEDMAFFGYWFLFDRATLQPVARLSRP